MANPLSAKNRGAMGRMFTARDSKNWKVVKPGGAVLRYPKDLEKAGRPRNDLDCFTSAYKLGQTYGGTAVRV